MGYIHRDIMRSSLLFGLTLIQALLFACYMTLGKLFDLSIHHLHLWNGYNKAFGLSLQWNYIKNENHLVAPNTRVICKKQWSSCLLLDFAGSDFIIFIFCIPNTDYSAHQKIQLLALGISVCSHALLPMQRLRACRDV